ncbi:unnamed protein product [Fusarium graminearum]|nr:unnamed protein product [Fusarium graminearum]
MATRIASGPCRARLGFKNLNVMFSDTWPPFPNADKEYLVNQTEPDQNYVYPRTSLAESAEEGRKWILYGGPIPNSFSSTQIKSVLKGLESFRES